MTDNAATWETSPASYQARATSSSPPGAARYGPDIPTESELHLLGDLHGRRLLELGCGAGHCSVAFAKQGAIVTGVDSSADDLGNGRGLADSEKVRVEFRLAADLADLAFLRSDSVDVVFSANAFQFIEDLGRVFRQVHRVLRADATLVFSLPHPAWYLIDDYSQQPLTVRRSYYDRSPIAYHRAGTTFSEFQHSMSDLYMGLVRSSFRVEAILEPEPVIDAPHSPEWSETFRYVPRTLIMKARTEGN